MRARWAVFISGRGSNLASLLEHSDEINLVVVVSSKASASGLLKARRSGVATLTLAKKIDWEQLHIDLLKRRITHICLAGFMKIVPEKFVSKWQGRLVNLHPSLLPLYPGLESIQAAYAAGADIGVTVHEVDEGIDTGRIILQRRCLKGRDAHEYSLARAEFDVHITEQRLLTRALLGLSRSKRSEGSA